ncbi:MAG: HigA family addiction module antitoxin [Thermodesulfovibrionales bacterium]|jgi:addiction module HigA family antidote
MGMHKPAHPGEVLKELWFEPLGLTLTEASKRLGITRKTISKIINGRGAITPEMALRLEIVFGASAQSWMNMQTAYDLWQMASLRKSLLKSLPHTSRTSSLAA